LKSKREESGLDLKYISVETKISLEMLESIENEYHAKLPEPVYVKGFIRSYAMILGIDANSVIHSYEDSRRNYLGVTQSKTQFTRKREKKRGDFWPRFIMGAVVMASLVAIVTMAVYFYKDQFRSESKELTDPAEQIQKQEDEPPSTIKISEQPEEIIDEAAGSIAEENADETQVAPPEKKPDILNLSIAANADTWLKVIVDGEKPLEYLLKPGDQISLNATSHYNLLIGNAGGVQLKLNGQPVQISGRMGQVVNLTLP
jgi:cytoskeleton protein RodZ